MHEIIAYVHKKITHSKKSTTKKFHVSKNSCKKGQNLKIVGEIIAYLQKQLQKIVHFKKLSEKEKNASAK